VATRAPSFDVPNRFSMWSSLRPKESARPWVALAPAGSQAHAVAVERGANAKPKVRWAQTLPWSDAAALQLPRRGPTPRGVLVLQREDYQITPLPAPDVPRAEWAQAARWLLRDAVEFDVTDAAVDVLEIAQDPQRQRAPQLLAVAAPQARLAPLVQQALDARLDVQAIDIPETALRNLSALAPSDPRAQALLQLQPAEGLLVLTQGGELLLSRHFDTGHDALTAKDPEAAQGAQDRLALELQRTFDNFERQFNHLSLARLLLAPCLQQEALAQAIGRLLYLPVQPLLLHEHLDLSAVPALRHEAGLATYLSALGAALRAV
jgi:MSHA biogenesis protein MshI